jgi:hypothetical protein
VNTRAPEVSIVAGYCGYKSGELVWQEVSSVPRPLPCCFLVLAFVCSWLPVLADTMDRGKRPWEGILKSSGPSPRLQVLLCEQG